MTHQMTRRRRGDGQHRAQCVPPLCMHMAEPPTAGAAADELDDEGKLNRDIANESYEEEGKRKDIGDYQYQAADSSKRTGVWRNAKTNKTVVGLRGTKDLKDLYSDVADPKGNILRGTQRSSDQYKADLKHFDSVKSKYGGDVSVTGHSLGASRAENVSRHRNVRGQAFNLGRGFGVQQVVEKMKCSLPKRFRPSWCNKMTRHHIRGDPLSVVDRLSYGKKTKVYDSRGLKSHMMSSFY